MRQRQRQHTFFSIKNGLHDILWKCSHGDLRQWQRQRCHHQMGLMPNCDANGNGKIPPFPSCNGYKVNFCYFLKCRLLVIFSYFVNKMNRRQYRILAERCKRRIFLLFMLWFTSMVNREIWVHPLNLDQEKKGEFYTLYPDLRNSQKEFFAMYCMNPAKFDELLRILEPRLRRSNTNMRKAISSEQKLVITLR